MNNFSKGIFSDKYRSLSQLFQLAVAFWFFRMVLPGMMFLFIPSFLLLVGNVLIYHRKSIFQKAYIYEFLKTFNPLIILGLFFVLALFFSRKFYERAWRDLFEYLINLFFLVVFFALTYQARKKAGFVYVFKKMTRIIWISAAFVATMGLLKYGMQLAGISIPIETQFGTTLNQDKNFFALYAMLGIIGLIPRLIKADTFFKKVLSQAVLWILILNILFSYSYRSVILLMLIGILLLVLQIIQIFSRKIEVISQLARNLRLSTLIFFILFGIAYIGWNNTGMLHDSIENYTNQVFENPQLSLKSNLKYDAFHVNKWKYAWQLFQERTPAQQIFGNGFSYLERFGEKYNDLASLVDYPHNPILSGLLYSGILGAIFIAFFILVALYYGGKYFRKYPLYSMMLFTSMLFVLFSGNSLFSVPIFLFLFSLSFMIRHQEISELATIMNLQKPGAKFLKETFDYILASLALVLLSPLLVFIILMVGFTMGWPVVYTQVRIGQNGKPFKLHKFRSMKKVKSETTVAAREQNRITRFGRIMRKYKLDELPELWNIIRGDMSFVGPRPDVPGYADVLKGDDRVILQLKPGLTGAASLKYMHEEELLAQQENPQEYNDQVIFPDKVLVNKKYMQKWTLWLDLKIIAMTALGKSRHEDKFL